MGMGSKGGKKYEIRKNKSKKCNRTPRANPGFHPCPIHITMLPFMRRGPMHPSTSRPWHKTKMRAARAESV